MASNWDDFLAAANSDIKQTESGVYYKKDGSWVRAPDVDLDDMEYAGIKDATVLDAAKIYADSLKPTDKKDALNYLYDDLHNPLMNVKIRFVGDSITWGYKASGESTKDPRTGRITDARNTTEAANSPSWANLLTRYLLTSFSKGALVHTGRSLVYSEDLQIITVSKDANLLSFYNSVNDVTYTNNEMIAKIGASTTSVTGEYIDLKSNPSRDDKPTELSFYTNASSFTLIYAELKLSTADDYKVQILIDDVLKETFSPYSAANTFNIRKSVSTGLTGRHKITIRNITTNYYGHFRLQGIEHNRRVSTVNDGNIGSTTKSWLTSIKLSDSIESDDDYVFVQLGTNDRVASAEISIADSAKNLRTIVSDIYSMTNNNAKIIMMCANAVTQTEMSLDVFSYGMRELNSNIKKLADELQLPFISHYENTMSAKLDGILFLADGLHPNDVGYRMAYDLIKDAIIQK